MRDAGREASNGFEFVGEAQIAFQLLDLTLRIAPLRNVLVASQHVPQVALRIVDPAAGKVSNDRCAVALEHLDVTRPLAIA